MIFDEYFHYENNENNRTGFDYEFQFFDSKIRVSNNILIPSAYYVYIHKINLT